MAERKDRTQLEPEGSIKVGSVRTFLTEMGRFEPEKGFTYFFRGHSRFSSIGYIPPAEAEVNHYRQLAGKSETEVST